MTTNPNIFPSPRSKSRRRRNLLMIGAATVIVAGGAAAVVMANRTQHRTDSFTGVSSVVVEVENGNLAISPAGDDAVGVRTTLNALVGDLPTADHRLENGVLTITSTCPPVSVNCYVEDELTIPEGIPVKIRTTTQLSTVTGTITVTAR